MGARISWFRHIRDSRAASSHLACTLDIMLHMKNVPLNASGTEGVKVMLRLLSGDIKTFEEIPADQQYHFKNCQEDCKSLRDLAVNFLALKIAKLGD